MSSLRKCAGIRSKHMARQQQSSCHQMCCVCVESAWSVGGPAKPVSRSFWDQVWLLTTAWLTASILCAQAYYTNSWQIYTLYIMHPLFGTVYRQMSSCAIRCWLLDVIWKLIISPPRTRNVAIPALLYLRSSWHFTNTIIIDWLKF